MDKHLLVIGVAVLIICVGLSGCNEQEVTKEIDTDGDGYNDKVDEFPYNSSEWIDSDNDGYGDNSDDFPYDFSEHADSDEDGVGDNSDAFPNDSTQWVDRDGDGYGDNPNGINADVFPDDPNEWKDGDFDDIGDNADTDIYSDTTLTINGINWICQNFGDENLCCVNSGLSWYYTVEGTNYPETGATAQIVSRLASGLITSLTMTNPARGTFTYSQLKVANDGNDVTLPDCQTITNHDENSEFQWCYNPS